MVPPFCSPEEIALTANEYQVARMMGRISAESLADCLWRFSAESVPTVYRRVSRVSAVESLPTLRRIEAVTLAGVGETGPLESEGTRRSLIEEPMDSQQPPPVGGWVEGVDGVHGDGIDRDVFVLCVFDELLVVSDSILI